MSKELWICTEELRKPIPRPFGLVTQPFELPARPANDIEIDPLQGRTQLRAIEVAVVVDPALNARIVHPGQFLQGLVAAVMKRPSPDCPADGRQCLRAGGRLEAVREDSRFPFPQHRLSRSECKTEKVKRDVGKVSTPVRILAVDDFCLLGMQYQLAGRNFSGAKRGTTFPRSRSWSA